MPNALDIIMGRESGGRNIRQQLVPQDVSSASGYFQMIKPTWQRWAKAQGIDTNRYPEAITAPPELQQKAAAYGFKTEGFKPWVATADLVGQEGRFSIPGALSTNGTPPAPSSLRATSRQQLEEMLVKRFPELRVTSRDRDPAYNASVGGAKNSQHTHGTAMDVSLRGLDPARQEEIVRAAREYGARGMGYYPNSQSAHFDLRDGSDAFWGQNYSKSSLGGTPDWFQKIAGEPGFTGTPTGPLGVLSATGETPPAPTADAAPTQTPVETFSEAFDAAAAPPQQQAPQPAPTAPMAQPATTGNEQGQAADLMAGLLARRRTARGATPMPPGLLG